MGRRSRAGHSPYENHGSGAFERAVLAVLSWWHRSLIEPVGDFFSRTADKMWGLRRPLRWIICLSVGAFVLMVTAVIIVATIEENQRDYAITLTQGAEEGVLLEEDYAACGMRIELQGRTISAQTSCATNSSFPAGTRVFVVQDPQDPERFLVVDPGQDWLPHPGDTLFIGGLIGLMVAVLAVIGAHRLLLNSSIPESPVDVGAALARDREVASNSVNSLDPDAESAPPGRRSHRDAPSVLDGFGDKWESAKQAGVNGWLNVTAWDVRIRGSLLGAMVIAVTAIAVVFGAAHNAELEQDRELARTQPVINTVLLEKSGKGTSTMVRMGTKAVDLAYEPRWEIFLHIGQEIPVVADPVEPGRLIPAEMADARGILGFLWDNAVTIVAWIAAVGFLAWLFIPRELAAAGEALDKITRRGKPRGRH